MGDDLRSSTPASGELGASAGGCGLPLRAVLRDVVALTESRFAAGQRDVTGIADLDAFLVPIEPGSTLLIDATTGADATMLALQIALRAARLHHPVVIASRRRPEVLGHRLLALASGLDSRALSQGRLSGSMWSEVARTVTALASTEIRIVAGVTINDLESAARSVRGGDERPVPMIVVDDGYLLPHQQPERVLDHLRKLTTESATAWVFTRNAVQVSQGRPAPRVSLDPTPIVDLVVRLTRYDDGVVAEVDSAFGWLGSTNLCEHRSGGGYFGRAEYVLTGETDDGNAAESWWDVHGGVLAND